MISNFHHRNHMISCGNYAKQMKRCFQFVNITRLFTDLEKKEREMDLMNYQHCNIGSRINLINDFGNDYPVLLHVYHKKQKQSEGQTKNIKSKWCKKTYNNYKAQYYLNQKTTVSYVINWICCVTCLTITNNTLYIGRIITMYVILIGMIASDNLLIQIAQSNVLHLQHLNPIAVF